MKFQPATRTEYLYQLEHPTTPQERVFFNLGTLWIDRLRNPDRDRGKIKYPNISLSGHQLTIVAQIIQSSKI